MNRYSESLEMPNNPEEIKGMTEMQGATLHLGRKAVSLDISAKTVRDDQGTVIRLDDLKDGSSKEN